MNDSNNLGKFIKKLRVEKDLSLRELAELTSLSHSYLNNLENGSDPRSGKPLSPSIPTLEKLSVGLNVSLHKLIDMVRGDEAEKLPVAANISGTKSADRQEESVVPEIAFELKRDNFRLVPVMGKVAAGEPIFAENSIEDWIPVDISIIRTHGADLSQYYYLRIHGNSMEPLFNDKDMVLVKQGPVEDGQIAVVLCGAEDACVKKIQYLQEQELLMLISRNPNYPPVTKPIADCQLLGRVVLRIGEPRW